MLYIFKKKVYSNSNLLVRSCGEPGADTCCSGLQQTNEKGTYTQYCCKSMSCNSASSFKKLENLLPFFMIVKFIKFKI